MKKVNWPSSTERENIGYIAEKQLKIAENCAKVALSGRALVSLCSSIGILSGRLENSSRKIVRKSREVLSCVVNV